MMKVMYITDQIYLHGGGERVLTNKSNYFIENNIAEVFVVTSEQKGNQPCYPINSKVVFKDLAINYNRKISYFSLSNLIKLPQHYIKLKRVINTIKPDIIITLSTQFDSYFLPFIHNKIPKIKEFHSSRYFYNLKRNKAKSFLSKLFYKINDYIESKYDYLAILTKDEKQYFKSRNTVIIPNALTTFPTKVSTLKSKIAISAGRIAPVKQFDKLITAWSFVAKQHPDWKLKIYGGGNVADINLLKILIDNYQIDEQVKLCGETNNLETIMLNSSLFIMSSKTECFPMVLLEAMSSGLPIISFDCPHGPKNIITNKVDGILTKTNDEKELANSIIEIINNQKELELMGIQARQNVQQFHSDFVMISWMDLFNKLILKSNV